MTGFACLPFPARVRKGLEKSSRAFGGGEAHLPRRSPTEQTKRTFVNARCSDCRRLGQWPTASSSNKGTLTLFEFGASAKKKRKEGRDEVGGLCAGVVKHTWHSPAPLAC